MGFLPWSGTKVSDTALQMCFQGSEQSTPKVKIMYATMFREEGLPPCRWPWAQSSYGFASTQCCQQGAIASWEKLPDTLGSYHPYTDNSNQPDFFRSRLHSHFKDVISGVKSAFPSPLPLLGLVNQFIMKSNAEIKFSIISKRI